MLRATYARSLTDRLKVGGSLNYIRDRIAETDMQTVSYDIGQTLIPVYRTVLGMSITNFGPDVQYKGEDLSVQVPDTLDVDGSLQRITDKFPLPLTFRLGIENTVLGPESSFAKSENQTLKISMDGVKSNDYVVYGSMGMEYGWKQMYFLVTVVT